jgi:hypothetical protein
MNPELEKKLIQKYPGLFRDVTKSPQETCMCWGIETGDGWFDIIDNLCGFIENLQKTRYYFLTTKDKKYINFHCSDVVFTQIKEKYGTLRVYWHFKYTNYDELSSQLNNPKDIDKHISQYSDTIDSAIDFSEYLSSKTCEVTGKLGKLYSKGWCVTLCKEEAIKRFGFDPDEEEKPEQS